MQKEYKNKTEKRARTLLASKDIPSDKMGIVQSLLLNNSLSNEEKYSAIIDIIKSCPNKKTYGQNNKNNKLVSKVNIPAQNNPILQNVFAPSDLRFQINLLHIKYKSTKLFRKRYLIHVNNRIGIGLQKRLIPTKRLLKILREIVTFHEKILSRLPDILMMILKDESIHEATQFNYLRIFRRWMMESPIIKYDMYELKWMDPRNIETELQSYVVNYFSFLKLDMETREQILLLVENTLRSMDDLSKEKIDKFDSKNYKIEKEKRNFKKEKIVYEFMTIMRSFLPSNINSENVISDHIKLYYGINSFTDFLIILMEALVFGRNIELKDIIARYEIKSHSVNPENWDYSVDFLKEIGKDPESIKKNRLQKLKDELIIYDELFSFLKLQMEGQNILQYAFENQWKIEDKKQKDYNYIYNSDFITFVDECVNFFNNSYIPLLNGTTIIFQDKNDAFIEGSIFNSAFFAYEINRIQNLLGDILDFKSNNPRLVISRDELKKIFQGKIKSMHQVERFIMLTGELFNQLGEKLHELYDNHRLWILNGKKLTDTKQLTSPLRENNNIDINAPIPFYNYIITEFHDNRKLTKRHIGKSALTETTRSGIIINICAFSYQLAYDCLYESLYNKLEQRKKIMKKIKDLNG